MSENDKGIEIAEISSIMSSHSGRRMMFRVLEMSGVDSPTFNPDPLTHAYNAGARERVGIPLRELLRNAAPGEYLQMMKENTEDVRSKRSTRDRSGDD